MNKQPSIGVVAISYNEEQDLPGFLQHLLPWVNEIVLVDDGSSDATESIARQYGSKLKFIQSPRKEGEYYAQQRNKGIDASESDWILHMDVDERVTPALAKEILNNIKDSSKKAYKFKRLNYFLHKPMHGGGWADWNQVHLAKREALRFEGMFHEDIKLTLESSEVGQLEQLMHHFNDASYSERLSKSTTYQKEVAHRILRTGKKLNAIGIFMAFVKEFVYKYFYKKGFKDGTLGLISAMHSASASFKAHALVWDEQNRLSRSDIENNFQALWKGSNLGQSTNG